MTVRAAVILMLGLQVAAVTGVLTVLGGGPWTVGIVVAGAAFAGTVAFARSVIG